MWRKVKGSPKSMAMICPNSLLTPQFHPFPFLWEEARCLRNKVLLLTRHLFWVAAIDDFGISSVWGEEGKGLMEHQWIL